MPQGVVDPLEVIEINEQHGKSHTVPPRQLNRSSNPILEKHRIRQAGEKIVMRSVGHLRRDGPCAPDVTEDQHCADDTPITGANGRDAALDLEFRTVAGDEDSILLQAARRTMLDCK